MVRGIQSELLLCDLYYVVVAQFWLHWAHFVVCSQVDLRSSFKRTVTLC